MYRVCFSRLGWLRLPLPCPGANATAWIQPQPASWSGPSPVWKPACKPAKPPMPVSPESRFAWKEHAATLADVPSTSQIVAAMEQLLPKTMASPEDRLTTQAHSIEVIKNIALQTDSLL